MPYGGLLEFGLNDNSGWFGLPSEVFTLAPIGIGRCAFDCSDELNVDELNDGELNVGEPESR